MGYTEKKLEIINKLKEEVIDTTNNQKVQQATCNAVNSSLTLATAMYTEADATSKTAATNYALAQEMNEEDVKAKAANDGAVKQAEAISSVANALAEKTYRMAEKTATAAEVAVELANLITDTKKTNGLISTLITDAAAAATKDAGTAVTDAIAALKIVVDTLKAASAALLSLQTGSAQIEKLIAEGTVIEAKLLAIKNNADKLAAATKETFDKYTHESKVETEKLNTINNDLTDVTAACNAAISAVTLPDPPATGSKDMKAA